MTINPTQQFHDASIQYSGVDGTLFSRLVIIRIFLTRYPLRTVTVFLILVLASLAEGLGLISLLPLLNLTMDLQANQDSAVTAFIGEAFTSVGLSVTLETVLTTIVVALTLKAGLELLAMRHIGFVMAQIATDFRLNLIRAVLAAQWSYFVSRPLGRFTNALISESARSGALYMAVCRMMAAVIQFAILFAAAFAVSSEMTILATIAGGVIWVFLGRFVVMARNAGHEQAVRVRSLSTRITDGLQGIKPLKAMGSESLMLPILELDIEELKQALRRQTIAKQSLSILREPIVVIFVSAGIYFALTQWRTDIAPLLLMAILFHRMIGAMGRLQQNYQQICSAESFFWSLHELTEDAEHARETTDTGAQQDLAKEVRFEDVSFAYSDEFVLDGISLEIPVGQLTAMVGPSGSGKTTVADLVCGLQRASRGRVTVDGYPVESLDLDHWRGQIGYVPQELFLFHESVVTNITLGDPTLGYDAAEAALRQAGGWDFVVALPDGLETIVGERGTRLSGGQRQRIAIARALVRKPRLLILDEATSGLDPDTEAAICATLKSLTPALTILAISHQPAIIDVADRIYRLQNGRLHREK